MDIAKLLKIFSIGGHQVNLCAEGIIIRNRPRSICDRPPIGRPCGVPMMLLIVRGPLAISAIRPHHIDVTESFVMRTCMQSVPRREKTLVCDLPMLNRASPF